jgi:hypothetical protein
MVGSKKKNAGRHKAWLVASHSTNQAPLKGLSAPQTSAAREATSGLGISNAMLISARCETSVALHALAYIASKEAPRARPQVSRECVVTCQASRGA